MKNGLIIAFVAIITLFSATSCEKTLDSEIYSQLTDDNAFNTPGDVEGRVIALYAHSKADWNPVGGVYNLMYSWFGMSRTASDELTDLWFPSNKLQWGSAFNTSDYCYSHVRVVTSATDLLNKISKLESLPPELQTKYLAEVKCLRAWYMFILYDWYGPVNVVLDPAKVLDKIYEPQPDKVTYFAAMVKDLTEAIPDLLDMTNGTSDWGRVNKGFARMLLMKLYMNEHDWANAKIYCDQLLSMGYTLRPTYNEVFSTKQNSEVIWAVPGGANSLDYWFDLNLPWDCQKICGIDARGGWGGYVMPLSFYKKFPAGDNRLGGIALTYTGNDGTTKTTSDAIVVKYLLPLDQINSNIFDLVAFRYADVILSKAEIEFNLNHNNLAIAKTYVKQITDRAGITLSDSVTANNFNKFLIDERGRELYWEGWRRMDMKRFGVLIDYAKTVNSLADNRYLLYPIPPSVIIESGNVIKNNPGY